MSYFIIILYHTFIKIRVDLSTNSNGTILGFRKICNLLKTLGHHVLENYNVEIYMVYDNKQCLQVYVYTKSSPATASLL